MKTTVAVFKSDCRFTYQELPGARRKTKQKNKRNDNAKKPPSRGRRVKRCRPREGHPEAPEKKKSASGRLTLSGS